MAVHVLKRRTQRISGEIQEELLDGNILCGKELADEDVVYLCVLVPVHGLEW